MLRTRAILAGALFFGIFGVQGGRRLEAAQGNSIRFVQLLLLRESQKIASDQSLIARQDNGIRLLGLIRAVSPTTLRQARRLGARAAQILRADVILQSRIDNTTSLLLALRQQLGNSLPSLGNPQPYTQQAASNAVIIRTLASRGPFGIPPASISQ
jgi:hypothetical protein